MRLSSDPRMVVVDILNAHRNTAVSGAWNLGVLTVSTSEYRPPIALKFSVAGYFDYEPSRRRKARVKQYVAVHRTLGYMRVAPQLRAILDADAVNRMLEHSSVLSALRLRHGGELANEISVGWLGFAMDLLIEPHPLSRKLPTPYYMSSWCEEHMVRALKEMAEIRKRVMAAGVELEDQQLAIDSSGHVHLLDIDPYVFNPNTSRMPDFTTEANELVDGWQRVSGKTMSPQIRMALMRELQAQQPFCTISVTSDMGEWRDRQPIVCAEEQEATQLVRAALKAPEEDGLSSAERAIALWPTLQHNYRSRNFWERITWLSILSGAVVVGRKLAFAKLAILYTLIAPSALNAQEAPGYWDSPEGMDFMLRHASPDFAEFTIRTNPRCAQRILVLAGTP